MDMITTTDLRTKVPLLLQALIRGESVELIHRSKVVGEIKPKMRTPKPFNPEHFLKTIAKLKLPKLSQKQMEKNYREHMMKKYGKNLPRR